MNKKIIAGVFALAFMSISASAFAEATTMPATGAPKMNEKMETSKDKADGKVDAKDAKGNDIETKDDVVKPKKVMPKKILLLN